MDVGNSDNHRASDNEENPQGIVILKRPEHDKCEKKSNVKKPRPIFTRKQFTKKQIWQTSTVDSTFWLNYFSSGPQNACHFYFASEQFLDLMIFAIIIQCPFSFLTIQYLPLLLYILPVPNHIKIAIAILSFFSF